MTKQHKVTLQTLNSFMGGEHSSLDHKLNLPCVQYSFHWQKNKKISPMWQDFDSLISTNSVILHSNSWTCSTAITLPGVPLATSAVVLAAGVALASRAGLAEGLRSGFLVEGLGLLTRLGSGDSGGPAPPNFFTESATELIGRLHITEYNS